MDGDRRFAIVTGASSGIGAATVRALRETGYAVAGGARRVDRVREVVGESGLALELDVTVPESVDRFADSIRDAWGHAEVLVNCAGGALGLTPVDASLDEDWEGMLSVNVMGLMRTTRACLPLLRAARRGHIVNLGSVAGFEVYRGGAGYTASKHAVHAISRTLRLELNGEPIRVTEIEPGMVHTDFSRVRFKGDEATAAAVYEGVHPLSADDIADLIRFAVTRPWHVNVDEIVVRPLAQAAAWLVDRSGLEP